MNDLVPDVVDVVPAGILQVIYPGSLAVNLGKELTPTQVKDKPTVTWERLVGENEDVSNQYYTLLMVDPDAPSRSEPRYREILHWARINIPADAPKEGQVLAEYVGSGPPKGSGLHRYIFLLYQQGGKIHDSLYIGKTIREGRLNFSARKFAEKHRLGAPIAANFYVAQYDDYVPIRNKEFTG
ncbi:protein D3-like [Drosophila tropicalis]|uniref:protein D3-like n=1 Tax=Drosophila tropicalis TaxID=46794 RepID=UPI0035AC1185